MGKTVQEGFPGDVQTFESLFEFSLGNAVISEEFLDSPPLSENYAHLTKIAQ